MAVATFGLVGSGYRAQFFLRIARALPHLFRATGIAARDPAKAGPVGAAWGVPVHGSIDAMLAAERPDYVIVSVSRDAAPHIISEIAAHGLPLLTETPPAGDVAGLLSVWQLAAQGARIQVAEQYPYQPMNVARIALARSGRLGQITYAHVSLGHAYHGMSLLRPLLGVGFAAPRITARRFTAPLVAGPGRQGPPREHRVVASVQTIAQLDFGDRLAVHDFTNEQYRSYVLGMRLLVRGERGELSDDDARWLADFNTPIFASLRRVDRGHDGSPESYSHLGVLAGGEWLFRNEFFGAPLGDDEIAGATMMSRMAEYAAGGAGPYDLAEALQDAYLALRIDEAALSGQPVDAIMQPWARV
jgi:predicted dehydrogenase